MTSRLVPSSRMKSVIRLKNFNRAALLEGLESRLLLSTITSFQFGAGNLVGGGGGTASSATLVSADVTASNFTKSAGANIDDLQYAHTTAGDDFHAVPSGYAYLRAQDYSGQGAVTDTFAFTITPQTNKQVTYQTVTFYGGYNQYNNPVKAAIIYQVGTGTPVTLSSQTLTSSGVNGGNMGAFSFDVSALSGITQAVTFSLKLDNGSGGNFCAGISDIIVNGTTQTSGSTPTAPSNLSATATSSSQINLTWTDNSSNETGFKVERATDSSFTQNLSLVTTTAADATSYSNTGLSASTAYYYRVRATNGSGDSANSNTANATTQNNATGSKLTGTVIGTTGSYGNSGNTRDKVYDGSLSTFFDAPIADAAWAGLDLGSTATITQIKYTPRYSFAGRMVNGVFQGSNTSDFSSGNVTLYTVTSAPADGQTTSVTINNPNSFRYVRYLAPSGGYGNVSEVEFWGTASSTSSKITGTVLGTTGSYGNSGNTRDKVFDGSLSTFFDASIADAAWAGLDIGSTATITQIRYAPRSGWAGRMVNGVFQGSNTSDFSSGNVTLYTVTSAPTEGQLTSVTINNSNTFRYVRYLAPSGGYGNVSEVEFWGTAGSVTLPTAPSGLSATATSSSQINLSWTDNSANETGFKVERATDSGFTQNLTLVTTTPTNTTSYSNTALAGSTTYYYRVRATNSAGDSANSNTASATTQAVATDYSPNVVYPDVVFTSNRIIDVTRAPYNADKTGATDCTAAIQSAISANINRFVSGLAKPMTLYFPNGTYLISNTLNWQNTSGQWQPSLVLQGQSRNGVIIKLANNASGFGNPSSPKAMVITASENALTGNTAFSNYIYDMTFDTGAGNPGAIGDDFMGSNNGGLRDVTIRSGDPARSGVCGLSMMRDYPGPSLFKEVRIDGFDYGVHVEAGYYSVVFENLTLNNQKVAGFCNDGTVVSVRKITSNNTVPGIVNKDGRGGGSLLDILDSTFTGGSSGVSAIDNQAGQMLLRNVSAVGSAYASVLKNLGSTISGLTQTEWTSQATTKLFSANPSNTLNLSIQDTPNAPVDDNFSDWANVMDYGANPSDYTDDTTAIQNAMNSGKPVVYLPPTLAGDDQYYMYRISSTITVPNSVKRIVGFHGWVYWMSASQPPAGTSAFQFNTSAGNQVVVDALNVRNGMGYAAPLDYLINGGGTVVIKDSQFDRLSNSPGAGPLFLEDNACGTIELNNPENVWGRQLNPEAGSTKVTNVGGNLWILGLKTENAGTALATSAGGNSEVFGGSFMATTPNDANSPAILNNHASTSASFYTLGTGGGNNYQVVIKEIQTNTYTNTAFGTVITLYRGANGTALTSGGGTPVTTQQQLSAQAVSTEAAEAIHRWAEAGANVWQLRNVQVKVADLGGSLLGLYSNGVITLDDDAGGYGWYIDPNVKTDSEFANSSKAPAGMDLLTVLMHEYGHALGLEHTVRPGDVMDDTLITGVRRDPTAADMFSNAVLVQQTPGDFDDLLRINSVLN